MGPLRTTITFVGDAARLDVPDSSARAPRLMLGSAPHGWLRVAWDGDSIAYARHESAWQGVVWARLRDRPTEVLPPIHADLARTMAPARWIGWLARTLFADAPSPLVAAGTYALAPLPTSFAARGEALSPPSPALGIEALHRAPRARRVRWTSLRSSDSNVFPLRDASADDASRVKAWRKHARDGTLPPALLAWISALDGYVVLDGHDRLHAASLERREAPLVSLHPVREHAFGPEVLVEATRRYERAFAHEARLADATRAELGTRLVMAASPWVRATSSARHEPDLPLRFARESCGLAMDGEIARLFAR